MAIGTSMQASPQSRIWAKIKRLLGVRPSSRGGRSTSVMTGTTSSRLVTLLECAGAPGNSSVNYNHRPTGLGDLCYDSTNGALYRCNAYTSATSYTWTQIV